MGNGRLSKIMGRLQFAKMTSIFSKEEKGGREGNRVVIVKREQVREEIEQLHIW